MAPLAGRFRGDPPQGTPEECESRRRTGARATPDDASRSVGAPGQGARARSPRACVARHAGRRASERRVSPGANDPAIELADRVATIAAELGIATALIGGAALAAHNYVRATAGLDLAAAVDPLRELKLLRLELDAEGYHTELDL